MIKINDVAAEAGVSIGTVSKFINKTQKFSPKTESRISDAIKKLGYVSNPLARSMVTGRTDAIGVTILDITNPHFTSLVKGASRIAQQNRYVVLIADSAENQDGERQALTALSRRVDGIILSSRMPDADLKWIASWGKPVITIGLPFIEDVFGVAPDSALAAQMLAQHLIKQKKQKIAYIGFPGARANEARLNGVKKSLDNANLNLRNYTVSAPNAYEGGRVCSSVMLAGDPPDAVICFNDLVAIGFIKEAEKLGLHVPDDVAVAGFDNIQLCEFSSPTLTTVDLQSERSGEVAVEKLMDIFAGKKPTAHTLLEPRLIIRESTGIRRKTKKQDELA